MSAALESAPNRSYLSTQPKCGIGWRGAPVSSTAPHDACTAWPVFASRRGSPSRCGNCRGGGNDGSPQRQPVDLKGATANLKARCARVLANLEAIEQQKDPIFQDPRSIWLDLTLSIHDLEAALWIMKKAWWP
jgi:hypothetical protein